MNRVQFHLGMSLREFRARLGTEQKPRSAAGGAAVVRLSVPVLREFRAQRVRAPTSNEFSVRQLPGADEPDADTILVASKLPLTVYFLEMYLLTQTKTGLSALELHRHLGPHRLAGKAQADGRNVRAAARPATRRCRANRRRISRRGTYRRRVLRGSENKVLLVAAQTTASGKVIIARV